MNWLGLAELIGGGALTAFGGGAVGVPLISAGVGTLASGRANDHLQQATQQAQQQMTSAYAPYLALGSGATSLLGRGLGIEMPATNAGMASPALPDSAPPPPARFNPYGDSNTTWGVLGPANPNVPWTDHPTPFNAYGAGGPVAATPLAAAVARQQRDSSYGRG